MRIKFIYFAEGGGKISKTSIIRLRHYSGILWYIFEEKIISYASETTLATSKH